jgi:hypothetical protein
MLLKPKTQEGEVKVNPSVRDRDSHTFLPNFSDIFIYIIHFEKTDENLIFLPKKISHFSQLNIFIYNVFSLKSTTIN